jgi:hypothetical protein
VKPRCLIIVPRPFPPPHRATCDRWHDPVELGIFEVLDEDPVDLDAAVDVDLAHIGPAISVAVGESRQRALGGADFGPLDRVGDHCRPLGLVRRDCIE